MMGINGREKRNKKKVNGSSINGIIVERKDEGMRFNRRKIMKKGTRVEHPQSMRDQRSGMLMKRKIL